MENNGKQLESLVRRVEELLLPQGFTVKANRKLFDEQGVPIAEFDIVIAGRIGTTDMSWLIECRDREDPAPAAWIEQLVGRRDRFAFNKVMAVSTTGFAPGAVAYAKEAGIELRTVEEMNIAALPRWLGLRYMTQATHAFALQSARVVLADDELPDRIEALGRLLAQLSGDDKALRPIDPIGNVSFAEAFRDALSDRVEVLEGLEPNGAEKSISARVRYANDNGHYVIDTDVGPIRIREIHFKGQVRLLEQEVPFDALKEYRRDATGETIAQIVSFPIEVQGSKFAIEMHNLAATGETHVLLRKLS